VPDDKNNTRHMASTPSAKMRPAQVERAYPVPNGEAVAVIAVSSRENRLVPRRRRLSGAFDCP
jgi:hypothetical protein